MLIKYENMEKFLEKVNTLEKKTPVYISSIKQVTKSNQITSNIVVQVLNGEMCYQIVFVGDLPVIQLVPDSFWNCIPDENIRRQAKESYMNDANKYDIKLQEEYDKMVKIFKDKGFTRIEEAVIE